ALDQAPFTGWDSQIAFWKALVPRAIGSTEKPHGAEEPEPKDPIAFQNSMMFDEQRGNDLIGRIQDRLEDYGDEVPVISFGWVALFIVIYILVVGPLDYFFLKKVVHRLEL